MRIIILRHGKRYEPPTFNTTLTNEGFIQADGLIEKLKDLKIDVILCSPFIRTIHTIFPYAMWNSKLINIENSLMEYLDLDIHTLESIQYNFDTYGNYLKMGLNIHYKSFLKLEDVKIHETEEQLHTRTKNFLEYIKYNYNEDTTILLVSHMSTCNSLKKYFIQNTETEDRFDMGSYEVYEL
uniref:Phosphoglycerate mutase family protein n=1 Tax=viral metagenome TaxID=1070528 RepID=A0A6C0JCX5_9ZZZZ